ncbi:MAG: histidine kinase dimerization/phosphoacceptor domain -containing protein [Bacteroidales bacterium]|nr:histidine kinase dimerization/phosphoacceptor domain -containing protein [Bacteroidales bacterium]
MLWKNSLSPMNRQFFFITVYLAAMAVLFTVIYSGDYKLTHKTLFTYLSWSMLPMMLFRFHTRLLGVPQSRSIYQKTHALFLYGGLLFGGSFLATLIYLFLKKQFPFVAFDAGLLLVIADICFVLFILAAGVVILLQFYHWRKKVPWITTRKKVVVVFLFLILANLIIIIFEFFLPGSELSVTLKLPHISLLPWLLGVAYTFVRYRFMPADHANAASKVIQDLQQVMLLCDERKRVFFANRYTLELLGLALSETDKVRLEQLFEEKEKLHAVFTAAEQGEQSVQIETFITDKHINRLPVLLSCTQLTDAFNDAYGYALLAADNSESLTLREEIINRKNKESILRKLRTNLEGEVNRRTLELTNRIEEEQSRIKERKAIEQKIKSELAEIEVMMSEIHNRVKTNINIILSLLGDNGSDRLLPHEKNRQRALYLRIHSILLIHQQILTHDNYGMVNFTRFLTVLTRYYAKNNSSSIKPALTLNAEDRLLWIDYAIPMAVAVNELLHNCYRHALIDQDTAKPEIVVEYRHDEKNQCIVIIRDNGNVDLSVTMQDEKDSGGLGLVEILVHEQLGGRFLLDRHNGTCARITVPLNESRSAHIGLKG